MSFQKIIFALAVTFFSLGALPSLAQVPEQLKKFADLNDRTCAQVVPQFINDPNFQAALQQHPVEVEKICICSRKRILEDELLQQQFSLEKEELLNQLKAGGLKSYLLLRSTQSAFQCIADEIDKSLKNVKLKGHSDR